MGLTAEEQAEHLALMEVQYGTEDLASFVGGVSPRLPSPDHVAPIRRLFERIQRGEVVQALVSMPPRHAKTTTIQHGLAWLTQHSPALENAFVSSGADYAVDRSREIQALAEQAGVDGIYGPANNWRTKEGGRLKSVGIGGQYVGTGTTGVQVIDDPYPTPQDALSANYREKVWQWYYGAARNRREPGSSAIVCHTRWHEDDLIGRLIATEGEDWEVINLPAIANYNEAAANRILALRAGQTFEDGWEPTLDDVGQALWPDYYPIAELLPFTRHPHWWWALYMGAPRPLGASLFGEPARFSLEDFSMEGCRAVILVDPAASEKTSADFSAIGVFAMRGYGDESRMYVLEVERHQIPIPQVVRRLRAIQERRRLLIGVEAVGGFKAVPQMLRDQDPKLRIVEVDTSTDKFIRSQPVSGAWNEGRVMVPDQGLWIDPYLAEMRVFTGVKDAHDDQVDITAHAWNLLYHAKPQRKRGPHRAVHLPFG